MYIFKYASNSMQDSRVAVDSLRLETQLTQWFKPVQQASYKLTLVWSWYQDVNPVPSNLSTNGSTTGQLV